MGSAVKAVAEWLLRRPGYMLLTACDERLGQEGPDRFRGAWRDVLLASALWSVASIGIWSGAWAIFGGHIWLPMPVAVTTAVLVLWPFRRAVLSLAEILGGRDAAGRALAAAVIVVVLALSLLAVRSQFLSWSKGGLPAPIAWLLPDYEPFRVLAMMPLWGAWSMLIVGQFCRVAPRTEPAVAAFCRGAGPLVAAGTMGAVLAATILCFQYLPWTQLSIPACAAAAAILGGGLLCRLAGGLQRKSLLATNLLTQIAFLLAYLANTR